MRDCYVIVDGLGFSQIDQLRLPFLTDAAGGMSVRPVKTLLAYSSGIYPSIWSGRYPDEHGVWGEFFYVGHGQRGGTDALRFLPERWDLQRRVKYLLLAALGRVGIQPKDFYGLPPAIERRFARVASRYDELPPARPPGIRMIDDVLDDAGCSWELVYLEDFVAHPPSDEQVARWCERDVLFLYIADADKAGHLLGPGTDAYREFLRRLDAALSEFVAAISSRAPGGDIFLFSDHGMNRVTSTIDVWGHLTREGLRLGRDYVAFFNSTIASFWFPDGAQRGRVLQSLRGLSGGRLLDDHDLQRYHLRFLDNRYGDVLFLVQPGLEIIPNFMSLSHRASLGMHGYDPDDPDTAAFLRGPGEKIQNVRDVTDIFTLIETNLGYPGALRGRG